MLSSEERVIFACRTCRDFGRVYIGPAEKPCPECSGWPAEKRADLLRASTREKAEKPSISEADLSEAEKALLAEWTISYPHTHRLTLLTWIEGRRYDPSKDEAFLVEARREFKKWQFYRHSNEGPRPEWVRNALATGDLSGLCPADRRYIEELRSQG